MAKTHQKQLPLFEDEVRSTVEQLLELCGEKKRFMERIKPQIDTLKETLIVQMQRYKLTETAMDSGQGRITISLTHGVTVRPEGNTRNGGPARRSRPVPDTQS